MEAASLHYISSPKRVRNPKRSTQTRPYIPSRAYNNTNLYHHSEGLPKVEMIMVPLLPHPSSGSRGNSLSPTHKKHNKGNKYYKEPCVVGSTNRLGPDPDCLPKDIKNKKVLFVEDNIVDFIPKEAEKFSGSASFPLAPPPSSLPMPKFSLKPKLSCKVEAGGGLIDIGATDNLCRLLNLRC